MVILANIFGPTKAEVTAAAATAARTPWSAAGVASDSSRTLLKYTGVSLVSGPIFAGTRTELEFATVVLFAEELPVLVG